MTQEEKYMKEALKMAARSRALDEVPVGAVIVKDGKIIARGWNKRQKTQNPVHHAEIIAIEKAAKKLNCWRLDDCTLYVTLEPCPMCAGAIIQSRIPRVVFGAWDPKGGCSGTCVNLFTVPQFNHHPESQGGILEEECAQVLKDFFREKRQLAKLKRKQDAEQADLERKE